MFGLVKKLCLLCFTALCLCLPTVSPAGAVTITLDDQGADVLSSPTSFTWGTLSHLTSLPSKLGAIYNGHYDNPNCERNEYIDANGYVTWNAPVTSNKTLYACWQVSPIITLNDQGATTASAPHQFTSGVVFNLTTLPTKTGYMFDGFFSEPYGAGNRFIDPFGQLLLLPVGDITLYANWWPMTFTVTLDHQGATTNGAPATVYLRYNTGWYSDPKTTTPISVLTTVPQKTNYTFGGYYTGTNGAGTQVIDADGHFKTTSAALQALSADGTIYAKWNASGGGGGGRAYRLILDYDDNSTKEFIYGRPGSGFYSDINARHSIYAGIFEPVAQGGAGFTLPASPGAGAFNGFWTQRTSGGTQVIDKDGDILVTSDYFSDSGTIFAHWDRTVTALSFDAGDGTTSCSSTQNVSAVYDEDMPILNACLQPTPPTGYYFLGYYDALSGGTQYYSSSLASVQQWDKHDASFTLHAQYSPVSVKVTYSCALGAGVIDPATYGQPYTVRTFETSGCSAPAGQQFQRWRYVAGGGVAYNGGQVVAAWPYYVDIDLEPEFGPMEYTVSLTSNTATTAGTTTLYTLYDTAVYRDSAHTESMTTSTNPITLPSRVYTVTYEMMGGSATLTSANTTAAYVFNGYYGDNTQYINGTGYITSAGLVAAKGYTSNSSWSDSWTSGAVTLPTPTRQGYIFRGWYTAETGGTPVGQGGTSYIPTADTTLYAVWASERYIITLDDVTNGGSGGTGTIKEIYDAEWRNAQNSTITSVAIPTKSGMVFTGYYTAASGGTQKIPASGVLPATTTFTSNTTLFSQYQECTCTPGAHSTCAVTGVSNNQCQYSFSCNSGYNYNGTGGDTFTGSAGVGATTGPACVGNTIYLTWANGGHGTAPSTPATCTYGDNFTTAAAITGVTGYEFNKWSVNGNTFNANTSIVCNNANLGATSGGATLTATWDVGEYSISLNNADATTNGTGALYTRYDTGVYLDSNRTQAMNFATNPITVPQRAYTVTYNAHGGNVNTTSANTDSVYNFDGYYNAADGNTQYIGLAGLNATVDGTDMCIWPETPGACDYTPMEPMDLNEWSVVYPYGEIIGQSFCSSQNGGSAGNWTYAGSVPGSSVQTAVQNEYTTSGGGMNSTGDHCYCKLKTPNSDSSSWVYWGYMPYDGYITTDCNVQCPLACEAAAYGMDNVHDLNAQAHATAFRTMLFSGLSANDMGYITSAGLTAGKGYSSNPHTWYAKWSGGSVTLPSPTYAGYTFDGWYDAATGGNLIGVGGASYTPTANITLHAHWTPNTYSMQYTCNDADQGYTYAGTAPVAQTANYLSTAPLGQNAVLPGIGSCKKVYGTQGTSEYCDNCFDFVGWVVNAEETALSPQPATPHAAGTTIPTWGKTDNTTWCKIAGVNDDWGSTSGACEGFTDATPFTVRPVYDPKTYTLSYGHVSGTGNTGNRPNAHTYTTTTSVSAADLSLTHGSFVGWCADDSTLQNCTNGTDISVGPRNYGNHTYYAKWACDAGYELSYDANDNPVCTAASITCNSGYYLPASGNSSADCMLCLNGNYCEGGIWTYDGTAHGLTACPTGYVYGGTGLSAQNQCKALCGAGQCLPTANGQCVNVGAGNWSAGGLVAYGSTLECHACATGLTTIGFGNGADESNDCGRVLHFGDYHIYLRQNRKTERTLNVKIGDTIFYGNMSTDDINMGYGINHQLKAKVGNIIYSIYDDSAEAHQSQTNQET